MPETLTPKQVLLTDEIANEKYVGFYAERRLSRMVITAESVLLLASFGVIVSLAHRPVQNRYVRIEDIGRAQAIQYSDLNYSPREGEVRTYLTDWANYRYTINRETVSKKYPMNYYFLSMPLANQYMGEDNATHLVSQVSPIRLNRAMSRWMVSHHVHVAGDRQRRDDCTRHGAREHHEDIFPAQLPPAP